MNEPTFAQCLELTLAEMKQRKQERAAMTYKDVLYLVTSIDGIPSVNMIPHFVITNSDVSDASDEICESSDKEVCHNAVEPERILNLNEPKRFNIPEEYCECSDSSCDDSFSSEHLLLDELNPEDREHVIGEFLKHIEHDELIDSSLEDKVSFFENLQKRSESLRLID
jgi:hypothetical protein